MAKFTTPRAEIRVRPEVGPRILPRPLIDVFYQSESEFRSSIRDIEKDPLFHRLVDRGVVERVRLKGRIPQHRYEEYKDAEMMDFFRRYRITDHFDWQQDFFDKQALKERHRLAKKYRVPVGKLLKVLRYCRYLEDLGDAVERSVAARGTDAPDFLQFRPSEELFDTAPLVARIQDFVERQGLSQENFITLFMGPELDEKLVLGHVTASLEQIRAIRRLVERIQALNTFQVEIAPRPTARKSRGKVEAVAEIRVEGLDCWVQLHGNEVYDVKYRVEAEDGTRLSREEQAFLDRLKAVNQRKNVFARLLLFLARHQTAYFLSGDSLDLRPLTQAQVALALDEEEATVSRLIRDKFVTTPHGVMAVKGFFHKVGKVVELLLHEEARLLASGEIDRPWTDGELQQILDERYHVRITRRCVTYHRRRRGGTRNYYARLSAEGAQGKSS